MPSRSSSLRRWAFAPWLALAAILPSAAAAGDNAFDDAAASTARVRALQRAVGEVRGLPFRVDVDVDVEDTATMRERMVRELEEQLDPDELAGTELTWRILGLIGSDYDVAARYADILEENVGGYFDIQEGRLVLVKRDMGPSGDGLKLLEDMVTAHELVHALQDQHFDLWALTRRELEDGDVALALQALVEGDASYAMLYRVPMIDPDRLPMERLAPMMAQAGGPSDQMGGKIGAAPAILREPLVFPYVQGLVFTQAVKKSGRGWDAVDAAYAAPPLSTEQVLHPEKYVGDVPDWPMRLAGPAQRWVGGGWTAVDEDTFGELGISLMLRQHGVESEVAETAAAGWDGDRYWTFQKGDEGSLFWHTTWDTEADADEFRASMSGVIGDLRPDSTPAVDPAGVTLSGPSTTSGVRREGSDVVIWLDLPRSRAHRLLRRAARITRTEVTSLDAVAPPPEARDTPAPREE